MISEMDFLSLGMVGGKRERCNVSGAVVVSAGTGMNAIDSCLSCSTGLTPSCEHRFRYDMTNFLSKFLRSDYYTCLICSGANYGVASTFEFEMRV